MYSITEASPLERETFRRGMEGWAVIACQIALNSHYKTPPLAIDGVFGPTTERVAKEVQAALSIATDGIVGPQTQEMFVKAKCKHAEKGMTPPGLLAGSCQIESSYQWACVSQLNNNGTHDYGTTQESLFRPMSSELIAAFNPDAAAHMLAGEISGFFRAASRVASDEIRWRLAALNHNWPAAAWAIAEGNKAWLDKPFEFTTALGYPTGLAYAEHYMDVATEQVINWSVA